MTWAQKSEGGVDGHSSVEKSSWFCFEIWLQIGSGAGGTNKVYSIESLMKKDTCGCLYEQDIEKAFYFS